VHGFVAQRDLRQPPPCFSEKLLKQRGFFGIKRLQGFRVALESCDGFDDLLTGFEVRLTRGGHDQSQPVEDVPAYGAVTWIECRNQPEVCGRSQGNTFPFDAQTAFVQACQQGVFHLGRQQIEVVSEDVAAVGLRQNARREASPAASECGFEVEAAKKPVFTDIAGQDDKGRALAVHIRDNLGKTARQNRLGAAGRCSKGDAAQTGFNSQQQQSTFDRSMAHNGNKGQRDKLKGWAGLSVRHHGAASGLERMQRHKKMTGGPVDGAATGSTYTKRLPGQGFGGCAATGSVT
jgi:hypothetical protein